MIEVGEPVAGGVVRHDLESRSYVVIFEHALIVVLNSDRVVHVYEELVVDPRMLKVVAAGSREQRQLLHVVHVALLDQLALHAEVIVRLTQIRAVSLVVVSHIFVPLLDFANEPSKFVERQVCVHDDALPREQVEQHCDHLVSVGSFAQPEDIEIETVDLVKLFFGIRV